MSDPNEAPSVSEPTTTDPNHTDPETGTDPEGKPVENPSG